MANLVQVECNHILDASSGTTVYLNPTTPIKVALCTAVGSSTAAGTEVVGGSYARQTLTMASASAGSASISGSLTYTSMPALTVTSVDEFDSAGTPIRRWFGSLTTPKTTNAGDTLSVSSYVKSLS